VSISRRGRSPSSLRHPTGSPAFAHPSDDERAEQARLAAIGRVAAGVAHDFNNIVTVIGVCARLLEDQEGLDDTGRQQVDHIRREADRAASLVWQILDFAHRGPITRTAVDLDRFFDDFLPVLGQAVPAGITLTFCADDADHRVSADAVRLEQILSNLATNACDAMPTSGRIDIALTRADGRIRIDVADTGTGIAPDVLPRIFEPFFSTNRAVHRTGLGLAQVDDLVAEHDGTVEVTSSVGAGTTFTVWLPALLSP
jgi:two-component system cell cycle sensor histidine kinase/response regulator CckA